MKCKKVTALFLVAAMTASMLVGCGDSGNETTTGGGQTRRPLPAIRATAPKLLRRTAK